MALNLIHDQWIPVRCRDGSRRVIAPWQIADPLIDFPDWPRPDLNIACCEFLIGLVYLVDPPQDIDDWDARTQPDPERLREKLAPFAPAFELLGDGPRFLQDLEPLSGEPNGPDMLFIDSAGGETARKNADLMVHRDRYQTLNLPLAAMALYTFQAFAPSGGAGNRTSMRGGGPLITLVDPGEGLWALIWANVPYGRPGRSEALPWMRPTRVSDKGQSTEPPGNTLHGVEAFFGMPRRLRLTEADGQITGVVQRPYGTNYGLWKHPLSPYYRQKVGTEWLPKHPRAGRFGYRNWLGILVRPEDDPLSELALALRDWGERRGGGGVLVAGWAMDNMKPRDFILSASPYLQLSIEAITRLVGLIHAAEAAGVALRGALASVLSEGEAREAEREAFFRETEDRFLSHFASLLAGEDPSDAWLGDLRREAVRRFDALALPELEWRDSDAIARIVEARKFLKLAFSGYGKQGAAIFNALGKDLPEKRRKAP